MDISGRTTGLVQVSHTFTATVSPITATQPITYVWQATGQSPATHAGGPSDTLTFTWSTTGTQVVTVTASNVGGTVSASHHITITEPGPGDGYEPDDTCADANPIATDGTTQEHNLYPAPDKDWVTFDAISGTTYLIEAQIPASSPADAILELYDQCDALPLDGQGYIFSPGVHLEFQTPANGDGIANETEDGREAARRGFAFAGTMAGEEWPPYIVQAIGPTNMDQGEDDDGLEARPLALDVRTGWMVHLPLVLR